MKIALLADNFPSPGSPKYVFVQQLVFAIVDLGHNVFVLAPQSITHSIIRKEKILPKYSKEKTNNGNYFEVYRPYDISFGNGKQVLYNLSNIYRNYTINKILHSIKPDLLYGHFWHSAYKLYNYSAKYKLPLFVACGEGDDAMEYFLSTLKQSKKADFLSKVNGVICVSSENKKMCINLKAATDKKIIVLPNCVDDKEFYPQKNNILRKKLGVNDEDFLIIFVGGFIARKGADRLMAAINKLDDKNIKLIFIGKPKGGDVVEPYGDSIVFKGVVEHEYLPQYLNSADLFVLPTLREGCSNAIVEALACGIPVVSSNRPFNDDILNDCNSVRVNPENIEEIAAAIFKFKNDRDFYEIKKNYVMKHCCDYSIIERANKILDFISKNSKN